MGLLKDYAEPYIDFLLGIAYNVMQTLEGLNLWTANFVIRDEAGRVRDSYWSASEAVALPFLFLLIYWIALAICALWAMKTLLDRKGVYIGAAIICAPGVLSAAHLWPNLRWVPDVYLIGSGDLGSPWGMFGVLLTGLITGWTAVVLLTRIFCLGDSFRHAYDHVWYSLAIVAGLLFVADLGASRASRELEDSTKTTQMASAHLLAQVRRLETQCDSNARPVSAKCEWASRVQSVLEQYTSYGDRLYAQFGPKSAGDLYAPLEKYQQPLTIETLRLELADYNQKECPVKNLGSGVSQTPPVSARCQTTPSAYCVAFPDLLAGRKVDPPIGAVAIANECVIPTMVAQRARQEKLASQVQTAVMARHWRWLFFILTAILAGGKVANATARLANIGKMAVAASDTPPKPTSIKKMAKRRRWPLAVPRKTLLARRNSQRSFL